MATKASSKKAAKLSDDEMIEEYINKLDHPLKNVIEAVREIIKINPKISERVKWNAPSYYYFEDLVTFNPRAQKHVHLVFHNQAIVHIKSALLEGDYKDRRMAYFKDMDDLNGKKAELENIINELVNFMNIKYV